MVMPQALELLKNKQESKTLSRIEFSASFAPDLLLYWVEEAHFCYLQ